MIHDSLKFHLLFDRFSMMYIALLWKETFLNLSESDWLGPCIIYSANANEQIKIKTSFISPDFSFPEKRSAAAVQQMTMMWWRWCGCAAADDDVWPVRLLVCSVFFLCTLTRRPFGSYFMQIHLCTGMSLAYHAIVHGRFWLGGLFLFASLVTIGLLSC